jgi:HSP20 family molecular chaperone IbpA
MAYSTKYNSSTSVYPGAYVLSALEEETIVSHHFLEESEKEIMHPPALISESADLFKIEVVVPGAKREEVQVYVDENMLKIFVAHKEYGIGERGSEQLPVFKTKLYEIEIAIPEKVDAEFSCGEIKSGVLCLYLQKSNEAVKKLHTRIFVY